MQESKKVKNNVYNDDIKTIKICLIYWEKSDSSQNIVPHPELNETININLNKNLRLEDLKDHL